MGKVIDFSKVVKKENLNEFNQVLLEILKHNQEDDFECEQYIILAVGTDNNDDVVNKIKLINGLDPDNIGSYCVAKSYIEAVSSLCNSMMVESMIGSEEE